MESTIVAFLASSHLVRPLVSLLLQPIALANFDTSLSKAQSHWSSKCGLPRISSNCSTCLGWCYLQHQNGEFFGISLRCRSCSPAPGSGAWLHALPSAKINFRLSDQELRVSVVLRLGSNVVSAHTCTCGSLVLPDGHHGLSWRRSADRQSRHHAVNDVIACRLRSIGIPAVLEPPGLVRGMERGPMVQPSFPGPEVVPWSEPAFPCPETLAPSHKKRTIFTAGAAGSSAES